MAESKHIAVTLAVMLFGLVVSTAPAKTGDEIVCGDRPNCCDGRAKPACAPAVYTGSRVALVVGSNDYAAYGKSLKSLDNAQNDARTLGDLLRSQSFSVRYLLETTPSGLANELISLSKHLREKESTGVDPKEARALFYFGGHGVRYGGSDYLLLRPEDDRDDDKIFDFGSHSIDNISTLFTGLRWYDVTFVFDACRSGAYVPGMKPELAARGVAPFETEVFPIASQHVIARTTTKNSAAADVPATEPKDNGLYMKHFAGLLGRAGHTLAKTLALTEIMVSTDPDSSQVPHSNFTRAFKATGLPWVPEQTSSCHHMESVLLDTLGTNCSQGPHTTGCLEALCRPWSADGRDRKLADYTCFTPQLRRYLSKLEKKKCERDDTKLSSISRTSLASLDPATARQLALRSSPAVSLPHPVIAANNPFASNETIVEHAAKGASGRIDVGKSLGSRGYSEIRGALLKPVQAGKDVGVPLNYDAPFTFKNAPVQGAPDLGYVLASEGSQQIRVDCVHTECGSGWAAVSVRSQKSGELVRGFTPVSELPRVAGGPQLRLTYEAGGSLPDERQLAQLKSLLESTVRRKGAVSLTAVTSARATDTDSATARLLRLEMLMRTSEKRPEGLADGSLIKSIVELEDPMVKPEVIVDFILPDKQ